MSSKTKVTISSYSGEIIRKPPQTNNLVSVYPLFYKQADYGYGYTAAKNKYRPLLNKSKQKEMDQGHVTHLYSEGFKDGWRSADFMVEHEGYKQFFHTVDDVITHIYSDDKLERRPLNNKGEHLKHPLRSTTIQDKFAFEEPSRQIKTKNKERFIVHKRIFGNGVNHSPRDGARFNPPRLWEGQ